MRERPAYVPLRDEGDAAAWPDPYTSYSNARTLPLYARAMRTRYVEREDECHGPPDQRNRQASFTGRAASIDGVRIVLTHS
jgi:hypothetical protein